MNEGIRCNKSMLAIGRKQAGRGERAGCQERKEGVRLWHVCVACTMEWRVCRCVLVLLCLCSSSCWLLLYNLCLLHSMQHHTVGFGLVVVLCKHEHEGRPCTPWTRTRRRPAHMYKRACTYRCHAMPCLPVPPVPSPLSLCAYLLSFTPVVAERIREYGSIFVECGACDAVGSTIEQLQTLLRVLVPERVATI